MVVVFFCQERTTGRYVEVSSLLEPCEMSCIDVSMLGRLETFAVATKFSQSYSPLLLIFTSPDAVNGLY